MQTPRPSRYTAALFVAAAALAGCGGSQPPVGASGVVRQGRAVARPAARGKSWMTPRAKRDKLMYISEGQSDVFVYTYPMGKHVATLTGFGLANGLCTDSQGDVFVTDGLLHEIVEYAHGGSTPIATLTEDPGSLPYGCSVDPRTHNLAVSNESPGNVAVFENAQGTPTVYNSSAAAYWACAYDDSSNLFVTGFGNSFLLELPNGANELTKIAIDQKFNGAGIQWDGKYLAVDNLPRSKRSTNLYRIRVAGSTGTVMSTIALDTNGVSRLPENAQYWLQDKTIIGAGGINRGGVGIGFWGYPGGGKTEKLIKTQNAPVGVAVSVSP